MVLAYVDAKHWGRNGYGWIYRKGSVYPKVNSLRFLKEETAFPETEPGDWEFLFDSHSSAEAEDAEVWAPSEPTTQLASQGRVNFLRSANEPRRLNILGDLVAHVTRFLKGI